MNDLYDALENCLQAIEQGRDIDSVLAQYPHLAKELRPILEASIAAQYVRVPEPSAEAVRRGRAKVLQRAAELREEKRPSRRRVIPVFQRLVISFTLVAIFLMSGTGLVRASSSALPGERLYPVKRTWEGLRLFFVFDTRLREALQSEYESERLHEVDELLAEGRHEPIQFAGVLSNVNGVYYVSGIQLIVLDSTQLPADPLRDGAAVIVIGRTNAEGFVEAESIQVLPPGSVVPVGNPIEIEAAEDQAAESASGGEAATGSSNEAKTAGEDSEPRTQSFQMEGKVESMSNDMLVVNGQVVYLETPELRGVIVVGAEVKLEGYFAADGRFIVTKVEVEEDSLQNDGNDSNSGSDDGSGDSGDDHSNDTTDDHSTDDSSSYGGDD